MVLVVNAHMRHVIMYPINLTILHPTGVCPYGCDLFPFPAVVSSECLTGNIVHDGPVGFVSE
jgi:hypothetical protein